MAVTLVIALACLVPVGKAAVPPACDPSEADVVVRNSDELSDLVARTSCSDGIFRVTWRGAVTLVEPIVVGNSTSLSIMGVGSEAAMDGGGVTRIIEVT